MDVKLAEQIRGSGDWVRVRETTSDVVKTLIENLNKLESSFDELGEKVTSLEKRVSKMEGPKHLHIDFDTYFGEEDKETLTEREREKLKRALEITKLGYADQAYVNVMAVVESILTRLCELKTGESEDYLIRAANRLLENYPETREPSGAMLRAAIESSRNLNIPWRSGGKHLDGLVTMPHAELYIAECVKNIPILLREIRNLEKAKKERKVKEKPETTAEESTKAPSESK
jgi:hypothetical protein